MPKNSGVRETYYPYTFSEYVSRLPEPYKCAVQSMIYTGDVEKSALLFSKEHDLTFSQESDLTAIFFMALVGAENVLDIAKHLTETLEWDQCLAHEAQIAFVSELFREMMFRSFDVQKG